MCRLQAADLHVVGAERPMWASQANYVQVSADGNWRAPPLGKSGAGPHFPRPWPAASSRLAESNSYQSWLNGDSLGRGWDFPLRALLPGLPACEPPVACLYLGGI